MRTQPEASRPAGISKLTSFIAQSLTNYSKSRGFDFGADRRSNVSGLSPYLRHRLILESDSELLHRYNRAVSGSTGIECFDAWVGGLEATGYLHNHSRMWFASIWIFTLQLPWQLGADFFYRNLIDGDPASNTLSWRWVAGLHTKGKIYLASSANIARYTDNRFNPHGQLAHSASPLSEARVFPLHDLPAGAVTDALRRATQHFALDGQFAMTEDWNNVLTEWARQQGLKTIVTAYAPVGPVAEILAAAKRHLQDEGIQLLQVRRHYDNATWPFAQGSYFKLKAMIPELLDELGIRAKEDLFSDQRKAV